MAKTGPNNPRNKNNPLYSKRCKPKIAEIEIMRQDGCTVKNIADVLGVNISTVYAWRKKYPELEEALSTGKEALKDRLKESLYKKAIGYEYQEKRVYESESASGYNTKEETWTKVAHPDVSALTLALKMIAPDEMKEISDPNTTNVNLVITPLYE